MISSLATNDIDVANSVWAKAMRFVSRRNRRDGFEVCLQLLIPVPISL